MTVQNNITSETLKSDIEAVLRAVDTRNRIAAELFRDSNKFEFDVCKLLLLIGTVSKSARF